MKKLKSLFLLIVLLLKCNPIKTIWINFKMLPIRQAIHLPIFLYGRTKFRSLKGKFIIEGNINTCMIRIGNDTCYSKTSVSYTLWVIDGTIIFTGPISFLQGTYIIIAKNGILKLGTNGTFIGSDSKIICFESISIGDNVEITWECQIIDTSFHYIKDRDNQIKSLTLPILIGNNVWIGNRSTISRGTVIPDYSIIASNSLLNKDYSEFGQHCLIAGCPAKIKSNNVTRIFDEDEQKKMDEQFGYYRTKL